MKVTFLNVGRGKMSWTAEVPGLSDRSLIHAIRKQRALSSSGIEFDWSDEGTAAQIYVGGFRCVGSLKVDNAAKLSVGVPA